MARSTKDQGADGRFLPGNKAHKEANMHWATLRKAFHLAFDDSDITKIAWELKEICFNQSLPPKVRLEAMTLVLDRIIGKPRETVVIDNEDALHNPDDLKIAIAARIKEMTIPAPSNNGKGKN